LKHKNGKQNNKIIKSKSGLETLAHLSHYVPATQERKQKKSKRPKTAKGGEKGKTGSGKKDLITTYSEFELLTELTFNT